MTPRRSWAGPLRTAEAVPLCMALVWAAALLAAAWIAPFYSAQTCSGSAGAATTCTTSSETLIAANGPWVLAPCAAPLVAALIVGGLLWRRGTRSGAGVAAWLVAGVLAVGNLLAMLSIGVFVVPVTIGVLIACALRNSRPPPYSTVVPYI